ncbi:hypothetical protein WN944_005426 [Citrus x changshan-huyou]|uniref:Uncharacterized protein n=1 Tax=Citrus x changshan-huyou TaxID=2935761 RepID=A0AAP0M6W4_9ROSI
MAFRAALLLLATLLLVSTSVLSNNVEEYLLEKDTTYPKTPVPAPAPSKAPVKPFTPPPVVKPPTTYPPPVKPPTTTPPPVTPPKTAPAPQVPSPASPPMPIIASHYVQQDARHTQGQTFVEELALHAVLGANVFHQELMATERSVASATLI